MIVGCLSSFRKCFVHTRVSSYHGDLEDFSMIV